MRILLDFLHEYEVYLYILIGLISIVYIRKYILAWQEGRLAIYGLEKEMAAQRMRANASILVALVVLVLLAFLVTTFVRPMLPQVVMVATPTLEEPTAQPIALNLGQSLDITPTVEITGSQNCSPGMIELNEPPNGTELSGVVTLKGVINVPDFGFYKYEYSQPGSSTWMIVAANGTLDPEGTLGLWDTSLLVPGDYLLRLVVTDNRSNVIGVCVIGVIVIGEG
ncbi:MAG: hypothetical protein JW704_06115 [Anaerolineaceae bacterium]|nr:hypothetical protein [Anaerolineaceae bacterium]MBN2676721.1 hypothetical protein [Anaerolineaceae bacterium]